MLAAVSAVSLGAGVAYASPAPSSPPASPPATSSSSDGTGLSTGAADESGVPDYNTDLLKLEQTQTALGQAQHQASAARAAYEAGRQQLAFAEQQLAEMRVAADTAAKAREAARAVLVRFAVSEYTGSNTNGLSSTEQVLLNSLNSDQSPADLLAAATMADYLADRQAQQVQDAADRYAAAAQQMQDADTYAQQFALQATQLQQRWDTAQSRVTNLIANIKAQIASLQSRIAVTDANQVTTDLQTRDRWKAYLNSLRVAHVSPPSASALRDPGHLPAGLTPLFDADGQAQPGAALAHAADGPLLVLPREVINTVTAALTKLGLPYVFGATGPDSYDCSGLTSTTYRTGGLYIPRLSQDQFQFTAASRIKPGQELPGDLVFFVTDGTPQAPGHVGMVIDPQLHLMIQAPDTGDVVKISDYDSYGPLGFGRPSILPPAVVSLAGR